MTVYFAQVTAISDGPIKIGFTTKSLNAKLSQLKWACPFPLKILGIMTGGAIKEHALHRRFKAYRLHGEWFQPHPEILAYIQAECTEPTAEDFDWSLIYSKAVAA